jgi:hypothetical protein
MIFANNDNWPLAAIEMNILYGVDIWSAEAIAESSDSRHRGTHTSPRHHGHATRHHRSPHPYHRLRQIRWQDLEL